MTQTPSWLRTVHRMHGGLTIVVVTTLLTLSLNDVFDTGTALRLFLAIMNLGPGHQVIATET